MSVNACFFFNSAIKNIAPSYFVVSVWLEAYLVPNLDARRLISPLEVQSSIQQGHPAPLTVDSKLPTEPSSLCESVLKPVLVR